MKKTLIIAVSIAVVTVFIFRDKLFSSSKGAGQHSLPVVSALELQTTDVIISKELPGRTTASQIAEIRPQVTGIITKRFFKEGSYVKEGEQLYQIDSASYEASYVSKLARLSEAMANKKTAQAKKERFDRISKKNTVISKVQHEEANLKYEQAVAQVKVAAAEVEQAKILLGYTKVNAPISGYIGKSSVTKGALVTANQNSELATITELNPILVDVTLSSNEFANLKSILGELENFPVSLIYNNDTIYLSKGKLLFHEVNVDKSTSSVQLRAMFPNDENLLFPGMFVRLVIDEKYDGIYLVPQNITWRDEKGSLLVWGLDENNIANPVNIDSEKIFGDSWMVKDFPSNVKIITENFMHLKPGSKVTIKEKKE